ncbi:endonuclease III [[Clostridium] colinum]|uniref:endonuclease III n=1 Tax=[Clostridium] colinum TaxID=36835 RepID=UPI002024ED94|nr:endonuclease III [[Clostridium] colinum]
MRLAERVKEVTRLLDEYYKTEDKCYLNHSTPYELLIATMLSAQCTDDRVNIVTEKLFKKYTTLESFASADLSEMEQDVKPTGFYHNKAKNIILATRRLLEVYDGQVPDSIEDLTSLAGVGRKTANVVRSHIFNIPSVVVDTHVKRISKKLGLVKGDDPVKIEFELMKILPKEHWIRYNTQVIAHGRAICKARNPNCTICFMQNCCKEYEKIEKKNKK